MDYKNLNDLWCDTLFNIGLTGHKLDSRAGDCQEIIGFQAALTHPLHNILFVPERKFSLSYACAEMLWYLSGTKTIKLIQAYAPQYEKFTEDGLAFGAYGYRWDHSPGFVNEKAYLTRDIVMEGSGSDTNLKLLRSQLTALIHLLKTNPNTRQAIMTMWDSGDLIHAILGDHKDLPCTLSLMFFVRNEKLHLVATMRSNDAWLGLPYDVFCFTTLQRIIAEELGLRLGAYVHQAGSEHIYTKNQEKIDQVLRDKNPTTAWNKVLLYPHIVGWNPTTNKHDLKWNIEHTLALEARIRKEASLGAAYNAGRQIQTDHLSSKLGECYKEINDLDPLFRDLFFGAMTKWMDISSVSFDNPLYANCQRFTEKINES